MNLVSKTRHLTKEKQDQIMFPYPGQLSFIVSPGHSYRLTAVVTGAFPASCAHCCVGDDSPLGQKGHFQTPFSDASVQGVRSHSAIPGLTTTHGNWVL